MVRMSVLRHVPVICGSKPLGLLQSLSLDAAQKRVRALIVSCGLRGKRVVLPRDVLAVADGFILVSQAQKYQRALETVPCVFVRDTTGLLVGRVIDHAIDEQTLLVHAIEMIPGYGAALRRCRLWIFAYARADERVPELTVPACLGRELIFSREGAGRCVCPP